MEKAIWEDLQATKLLLLQTIEGFKPGEFNVIPFAGSWTAGQVAEHILLSASGGVKVLNGGGQTTERPPAENVGPLRDIFLNFDIKMISPDFIKPSDGPQNRDELSHSLSNTFEEMIALSQRLDLTLTFTGSEMPQFGMLTRLEWLSFILFHTQRHIRQLQNIRQCL